MGYDLGAVVPLAVDVRNAAGDLADAATVALAITLPDGTTASPAVTNPPASTGRYGYDYPSVQPGRHLARWTTTDPVTAYTDTFYVHGAASTALVSLADTKAHLNIDPAVTDHDAELRDAILTASDVAEGICGSIARRTVTETHSGRGQPGLVLRRGPVISITSVTEDGTAVDSSGYSLSDAGVLYRVAGYQDRPWRAGRNNIAVTYAAGTAGQLVAPAVLDSVKELVRINFRPQLGGDYASPFAGNPGDEYAPGAGSVRLGFFVPNKIVSLLRAHAAPDGFA